MSTGVEALVQNWSGMKGYAYPPISLIPRVLSKLQRHPTAIILLIAPFWPSQIWFPSLRDLLVDLPIRLPDRWDLLRAPGTDEFYPNPEGLKLTAWPLSASPSRRQDFLRLSFGHQLGPYGLCRWLDGVV